MSTAHRLPIFLNFKDFDDKPAAPARAIKKGLPSSFFKLRGKATGYQG